MATRAFLIVVLATLCGRYASAASAELLARFRSVELRALRAGDASTALRFRPQGEHLYAGCGGGSACAKWLFVMLPGTHGSPRNTRELLRVMAASGMAALGLDYQTEANAPGLPAAAAECRRDDRCFTDFRRDRALGAENSRYVLSAADGIAPRLRDALRKLAWTNFLDGGDVRWDRVVVAGLSQGAGMAAWLGKQFRVRRVVQFGGTSDAIPDRVGNWHPASWTRRPSATPSSEFFAFVHPEDPFYPRDLVVWEALGMGGTPAEWTAPHGQKLLASFPKSFRRCVGMCAHAAVVADRGPKAPDGSPLYLDAWVWMGNPEPR